MNARRLLRILFVLALLCWPAAPAMGQPAVCGNGVIEGGPRVSCSDILDNGESVGDGIYLIDPDGAEGLDPFDVYCDMTTAGGGWTLVMNRNIGVPTTTAGQVTLGDNNVALDSARWQALQAISTDYLGKEGTDYAVGFLDKMKSAGCTPLSNDLTVTLLAHEEIGCSSSGADYCLWGTTLLQYNTGHYNLCTDKFYDQASSTAPFTAFGYAIWLPSEVDSFVRGGSSTGGGGEQCDDGNTAIGDGCSDTCAVEDGFECTGEPSNCTLLLACGNGVLEGLEECDDGNTVSGDGCSSTCTTEAVCGDGFIDGGPRVSCSDILDNGESAGDGTYLIDPDGAGGLDPFDVYCDMTTSGGGWTLVMNRNIGVPPTTAGQVILGDANVAIDSVRWQALKTISDNSLSVEPATGLYAFGDLNAMKNANCTPLTDDLTDTRVAHEENSGCTGSGLDYCNLGSSLLSYSTAHHNYCSSKFYDVSLSTAPSSRFAPQSSSDMAQEIDFMSEAEVRQAAG